MLKKFLKILIVAISSLTVLVIFFLILFNLPVSKTNKEVGMGVTFSHRYATDIGLNWKEAYIAMLDELEVRKIRIPVYWDLVEVVEGEYDFSDVDWQLEEAGKRKAEVILAIGQKVPRWPECHIPEWARDNKEKKDEKLLQLIEAIVNRYENEGTVKYWQVENEPFLDFGICPDLDKHLLDREIAAVRVSDPTRKIIITDSGELSIWIRAAKRADIFGTTLYRTVYTEKYGYFEYPVGPNFFRVKKWATQLLTDAGKFIVIELQGEPWLRGWTTSFPLEDQLESMNEKILADNVEFAKKTGFEEVYIWGVEWWYWTKVNQNYSAVWDEAKIIFSEESNQ